eukprot:3102229-Prymnesium_polylepis.1
MLWRPQSSCTLIHVALMWSWVLCGRRPVTMVPPAASAPAGGSRETRLVLSQQADGTTNQGAHSRL